MSNSNIVSLNATVKPHVIDPTIDHWAVKPTEPKIFSPQHDRAMKWIALGVPVFPVRDKKPLVKWKDEATLDAQKVARWWAEWPDAFPGLNLGAAGLCAIDFDLPNHPRLEEFASTWNQRTNRGLHYIYRGAIKTGAKDIGDNIDTRGPGGYVVAYADPPPSLDAFEPVPEWIAKLVPPGSSKATPIETTSNPDIEWDLPGNVASAKKYLDDLANGPDKIIRDGERNTRTFQIAQRLREFGVSREKTYELIREILGDHYEGVWPEEAMWFAVNNAYEYKQNPDGMYAKPDFADTFANIPASPEPTEANGKTYPSPKSGAELEAGDFPRAEYILEKLILRQHVNLLYGDGGTGKTFLSEQIGVAIAAGKPLFDFATKQAPVLLVLAEDDYGETKARLEAICKTMSVKLADLPIKIWCLPGQDLNLADVANDGSYTPGPFMAPLVKAIKSIGPSFVVLDTVSDFAVLDEIKRLAVNTFCKKVLGGICKQYGVTILLNAHPSKASINDGTNYSGSTAWNNAVRNRLTLERKKDADETNPYRKLSVAKANYGRAISVELYMFDSGFIPSKLAQGDANAEREVVFATVAKMIRSGVAVVRGNGNGQKAGDVAKAVREEADINLSPASVKDHLGALERVGRLIYRNADHNTHTRAGYALPDTLVPAKGPLANGENANDGAEKTQ